MGFFLRMATLCALILLVRPANASVVSDVDDYSSGSYYTESGSLDANSTAVFEYSLNANTINTITANSTLSQINLPVPMISGNLDLGGIIFGNPISGSMHLRQITSTKSASEYSKSDPGIVSASGGTGIYDYASTALLKDQISISGNSLFITFVNLSPTATATFVNQFTLGGTPEVVKGTIVSQGSLSAVPLPASFPLFAVVMVGLTGFGLCYRKRAD